MTIMVPNPIKSLRKLPKRWWVNVTIDHFGNDAELIVPSTITSSKVAEFMWNLEAKSDHEKG